MMSLFRKYILNHKNNKFWYYLVGLFRELIPSGFYRASLKKKLSDISKFDHTYLKSRLNYYNKLSVIQPLSNQSTRLSDLKLSRQLKVYYFDSAEYTRYYDKNLRAHFLFGDIIKVPDEPSFVKSRPIQGNNENSVLLKLNKVRHFMFVTNDKPFTQKKNLLVWRGVVLTQHRTNFLKLYFHHPMCDLGKINRNGENDKWSKNKLPINQHLKYKFILCIEGNDVASNLKWVMSSNSLAVMPKPKYETWFMEGTLIPDYHYVVINDDYSNLEEKLRYYIEHPDKARQIIEHAHDYVNQFKDQSREDLLSLLVMEKYFIQTGQRTQISH